MEHVTAGHRGKPLLSATVMAKLLGLSLDEYLLLNHKPMQAYEDGSGTVTEFYIHVSINNDQLILAKLPIDQSNFIRFKADQIYALCDRQE